jgi:hypothetical protein
LKHLGMHSVMNSAFGCGSHVAANGVGGQGDRVV